MWTNFNFSDTAFHLSVANAFTNAPTFPPADLDTYPSPLKYHFLADFYLAHFNHIGLEPLRALCLMNLLGALVLVGALGAAFTRWLDLPARWTALALVVFLFLGAMIPNAIHYLAFKPPYFDPSEPIGGVLLFHYFNFESTLTNPLEPQADTASSFMSASPPTISRCTSSPPTSSCRKASPSPDARRTAPGRPKGGRRFSSRSRSPLLVPAPGPRTLPTDDARHLDCARYCRRHDGGVSHRPLSSRDRRARRGGRAAAHRHSHHRRDARRLQQSGHRHRRLHVHP